MRLAIIGRPNVGKSSLLNRLLGAERVIVSERAGTTRDAIDTELEVDGRRVVLVDTAGIRRRSKIAGTVDYYAQLRAERAAERADVAIVVCDASEGVTSEDLRIAELAMRSGCATIVALNKWDVADLDLEDARARLERRVRLRPPLSHDLGEDRPRHRAAAARGARARRPPRRARPDPGAQPLHRRRRRDHAAALEARQAPAPLLRRPGRPPSAALRDPGQRPPPDLARLGLSPREPPARALWARGVPLVIDFVPHARARRAAAAIGPARGQRANVNLLQIGNLHRLPGTRV